MKITQLAINFKTTVYVLIVFIIIAGAIAVKSLPLEASPEVKIPIMIISTTYPGVAPEDVERLVTNIIERELSDLKDVKKISSQSSESHSAVTIEFEAQVDLDLAYQKVRDKVDKAKPDLPSDANEPTIIEINIAEFPMMLVSISGEYELDKLKLVAEDIQNKIEAIPGILSANLTGGLDREIQVLLEPKKMEYYQIGIDSVINRIQQEHRTTPAGNLDIGDLKYSVRIPGEYKNTTLMEDIIIKAPGGNPVFLKDIGYIEDTYKERETISRMDGTECITLRVVKRAGENLVDISLAIKEILEENSQSWPATTKYSIYQDQSEFIKSTVADLVNNIISGFILVLIVLFFSMGIRNAFFVAIAIPMSMLMSFIILMFMGITLNMVVLFSLILALGMLVDNSIVVVENIFRHTQEGSSRKEAALKATQEIAWPIIASTATTVMMFAPLLFWSGIMGEFMKYLPITIISVLSSSLFVALVINPTIASDFLKKTKADPGIHGKSSILSHYEKVLKWSLNKPFITQGITLSFFAIVMALLVVFGQGIEFFPKTTPERAQIVITAPQGTILDQTNTLARKIEKIALAEPNVKNVITNVGTGGGFIQIGSASNSAVLDLEFKDRKECIGSTWNTIASLRKQLATIPGAEFKIETEEMGPPTGPPVSVEISGDDYETINHFARQVKNYLYTIDGLTNIKDNYETGRPEIKITVDREKAMLRKVNTESISTAIRAAINGIEASVLREGDQEYDIIVRYDEKARQSIDDILDIRVTGEDDVQIPVRDVAIVETTGGFGSINHIEKKRTIAVTADINESSGKSSSEIMPQIEKELTSSIKLPSGYTLNFSGENEEEKETSEFLMTAFMIGFMLMALILITQFNSIMRPGIILGSVLMSFVGVFIGLLITNAKFTIIMHGMGIISLAGVVVNNAIVLIDYTDQLKNTGMTLKDSLLKAGLVRFRPVILTAATTILGLLPMALGIGIDFTALFSEGRIQIETNTASSEFWGPMAQAVCFGLLFATPLTLILVPAMYQAQENAYNFLSKAHGFLSNLFKRNRKSQKNKEDLS